MRIAQIAPLTEAIPPKLYGGTERVVSWLTEELVSLGHEVTLFASGDSVTQAKVEPIWPQALRLDGRVRDPMALHMSMLVLFSAFVGVFLKEWRGCRRRTVAALCSAFAALVVAVMFITYGSYLGGG